MASPPLLTGNTVSVITVPCEMGVCVLQVLLHPLEMSLPRAPLLPPTALVLWVLLPLLEVLVLQVPLLPLVALTFWDFGPNALVLWALFPLEALVRPCFVFHCHCFRPPAKPSLCSLLSSSSLGPIC